MMPVMLYGGRVLIAEGGKVAVSQDCCCDEDETVLVPCCDVPISTRLVASFSGQTDECVCFVNDVELTYQGLIDGIYHAWMGTGTDCTGCEWWLLCDPAFESWTLDPGPNGNGCVNANENAATSSCDPFEVEFVSANLSRCFGQVTITITEAA